ncbi:transposase family protein [Acinetobacter baumannii]|nr:transposase family protein [Acinetobacter baumannii]TPV26665.1 transposase family protein [Acinetobacter baumannii]
MKYIDSNKLSDPQFKRYTGISWSTFYLMVEQLQKYVSAKGRPPKLSLEDQVLLCLSYWREYRTLFHVATSYGVSEPTASRIVRHVEDCLIRSNLFNLSKDLPEGEGAFGRKFCNSKRVNPNYWLETLFYPTTLHMLRFVVANIRNNHKYLVPLTSRGQS